MTSLTRTLFAAVGLSVVALSAQAQMPPAGSASMPHVDKREARQQARISKGAASGALTAKETQALEKRQGAVNQAEANAKADGTVTAKERRHLNRMQDRNSHAIRRQKHDAQTAASASAK